MLLLAGTAEATALAGDLAGEPGIDVQASLAGRTRRPATLPCAVRTGGFGGAEGLTAWLRSTAVDLLVDATHPFAARMPHHAAAAAAVAAVPRVRLVRPAWTPVPGDRWHEVGSLDEAATAVTGSGARRVLLTTGRLEVAAFAPVRGVRFVVRSIEPPAALPWPDAVAVLDRGPYTVEGETALLREHGIDAVVTRNSGGTATAAKLVAARTLGLPVVMVRRPPVPPGPVVATPAEAAAWVRGRAVLSRG